MKNEITDGSNQFLMKFALAESALNDLMKNEKILMEAYYTIADKIRIHRISSE